MYNTTPGKLYGPFNLRPENYREYEFGPEGERIVYRIDNPVSLFYRRNGTTHRVVDAKLVTHVVPAPGYHGCVIRWEQYGDPEY